MNPTWPFPFHEFLVSLPFRTKVPVIPIDLHAALVAEHGFAFTL